MTRMIFMGAFQEEIPFLKEGKAHFIRQSSRNEVVDLAGEHADRPVIIDICSNAVGAFLAGAKRCFTARDTFFDLFVILVRAERYTLHRGMWTADRLHEANVPWEQILFLPAQVKEGAEKEALSAVQQVVRDHYAERTGPRILADGFIEENPVFDDMYDADVCLADLSERPDVPGRWSLCCQSERKTHKRVPALASLEGEMNDLRPRMEHVFREVMTYLPESSPA